MLRTRALCDGRELNGLNHGRHNGCIGGIAAHPIDSHGRCLFVIHFRISQTVLNVFGRRHFRIGSFKVEISLLYYAVYR